MQGTVPKMASILSPTALLPKDALAREAWKTGDSTRSMTTLLSSFWQILQVDGPYLAPRNAVFDAIKKKKKGKKDFSGVPVVKISLSNAGVCGFDP